MKNLALTEAEIERALIYLHESRDGVARAVEGLTGAQWNFKPGADRWSVAEILEHLSVVEERVVENVFPKLNGAPATEGNGDSREMDALVIAKGSDRSTVLQAPPAIAPSGRWAPEESLERFLAGSERVAAFLQAPEAPLRGHLWPHPALGPLDGYQWVSLTAAHNERHTKQILEVKADANFPAHTMAGGAI